MNDYDTDQAKELRRARLLKIKPKAARVMLTESEFHKEYVEYRFVSLEHLVELEETNNIMFCPACAQPVNNVMAKRRVLHVSYDDDVLGNYPLIATVKCQGCEWEEMIPVVKQELTDDDRTLLRRFNNAQAAARLGGPGHSGLMIGDLWSQKIMDTMKMEPGMIHRMGNAKVDFTTTDAIRFGQAKADRTWESMRNYEQERREIELARKQIEMIMKVEAEQRKASVNRTATKQAMMGQMYGMGQARLADIQSQYQNAVAQQMATRLDDQLRNSPFIRDELTEWKESPASAAKTAHKTLTDHIKILRDKFDKKARK